MKFSEGKVIKKLKLKGKEVVFRYPRKSDIDNFMKHINGLVGERAHMKVQKKVSMSEERKWLKESIEKIKKGTEIQLCIEVDGKFAGSGRIYRDHHDSVKHVAKLGIAVDKEFRGMGIGPRMLETLEELAKKEFNAKVVKLSCFSPNKHARHVYEKAGFREVGKVPMGLSHYGNYCDQIIMAKVLK